MCVFASLCLFEMYIWTSRRKYAAIVLILAEAQLEKTKLFQPLGRGGTSAAAENQEPQDHLMIKRAAAWQSL